MYVFRVDRLTIRDNILTKLIGFLPHCNVYVSIEYTGRSVLIHVYGSLPGVDATFLVSVGPQYNYGTSLRRSK